MYIAKTANNEEIIIKFTNRYSIELHSFCAERGHAPRILGFGLLPGGWFGVAMEYVSSATHPSASRRRDLLDNWRNDLTTLMREFHNAGLVHGDLREPNILCDGEKVILVDFDWGGRVGEVSYPTSRLCDELLEGRNNTNPKITKDDDVRVLRNRFEALGEVR